MKKLTFIEKLGIGAMLFLIFLCTPLAKALEFQVDKGETFNFTAPIENLSNSTAFPTGLNNTAFYIDINNTNTWTVAATNITGTFPYLWQLNSTETNGTGNRFSVMYNASGCWQYLIFNTKIKEAIDAKGTSNLTTADLGGLTNVTLAATQTGVTIPTVTTLTNGVTVTTNNDKTGYSLTTAPPTKAEIRAEMDANSTQLSAIVEDTNELQTNQGNWATATGFATPADLTGLTNVTLTSDYDAAKTASQYNASEDYVKVNYTTIE